MTLKSNDYALINGHPRGRGEGGQFSLGTYVGIVPWICRHLLPIFSPRWGIGLLCNFIAESLRKRPQRFVIYLAEMAGRENNEGSIENVVLSNSLTVK